MSNKNRILEYLQRKRSQTDEYIPKTLIQEKSREATNASYDYTSRELRHLEEEKKVEVKYIGKAQMAHYRAKILDGVKEVPYPTKKSIEEFRKGEIKIINGVPIYSI